MMKKSLLFIPALMICFSALYAQPQGGTRPPQPQESGRPAPPKQISPEEFAKGQADMMKAELGIDQKQYKKVYNFFKKDQEHRQSQSNSFNGFPPPPGGMGGPGGMPGGGMPDGGGGMGGPGGGMRGPGGGMQGGGMGGPGGGMPGGGQGMSGQGGPRDGMGPGPEGMQVSDEYLEKQEKKLKKILTPDQYSAWRAKHPAEHHELPPLELK